MPKSGAAKFQIASEIFSCISDSPCILMLEQMKSSLLQHAHGGVEMKKRSFVGPGLLLSLLIPLMLACAGGSTQKSSTSNIVSPQTGEELYILDSNPKTAQHIIALPLKTANSTARLTLPAGLTDQKHQRLYIATPLSTGSVQTTISIIDTSSGATVRTLNIPGNYSTADRGYADSMLSGDGSWLALRAQNTPAGTTSIALVDTRAG